jgi:parallel beta-helix repeat protein
MGNRTVIVAIVTSSVLILLFACPIFEGAKANFYLPPAESLPAIQINPDGSIAPVTDLINQTGNTYYLNSDIIQQYVLEVHCSNIVIDGQNHTIDGRHFVGSGIFLSDVTNVTVKNTRLSYFTFAGVYLDNSSNCTVSEITAENIGTAGILLGKSHGNIVTENQIDTNSMGIQLELSSENELFRNNITSYGFDSISDYPGIMLMNSPKNSIQGNNIIGKFTAVSLITHTIYPYNTSSNKLFLNNFVNNSNPVYFQDTPFVNSWDNGVEGNYWSSYNGTDADKDGVGDVPYVLNENNVDHFPLMCPFGSPEVEVFEIANSTYKTPNIPLTFNVPEKVSWVGYSLDDQTNVTLLGNTSLSDMAEGDHSLILYANNTEGNMGTSGIKHFTVVLPTSSPTSTSTVPPSPSATGQPTQTSNTKPAPSLPIEYIIVTGAAVTGGVVAVAVFLLKKR